MPPPPSTTQNRLFAAFPRAEYDRVAEDLELVPMPLGQVLSESGRTMQYVYFPTATIALA